MGKTCRIIQTDEHTLNEDTGNEQHYYDHKREYVYTQGDSVYYYINNNFSLLYNFNAQVGDVWNFPALDIFSDIDSGALKIDSIGVELIDGVPLRYLWVSKAANSCYGYYHTATKIVERIGGVRETLYPIYLISSDSECGGIVADYYTIYAMCYQDNNLFYGEGDSCVYVVDVQTPTLNHAAFNCYYNALSAELILTTDEATAWEGNFALYDLQGKTVATQALNRHQATHQVALPPLPAGIYAYTFSNSKGVVLQRGKVVIIEP